MTKFDIRRFLFDEQQLERELIILLSIFHASSKNQSLLDPQFKAGNITGHSVVEEYIIQKNLISTAIILRMIDDRFRVNSKNADLHFPSVGKLTIGGEVKVLSLRQACNKIVHSNELKLKVDLNESDNSQFLAPLVIMKGTERNSSWSAELEIPKYVVNGLEVVKNYDE